MPKSPFEESRYWKFYRDNSKIEQCFAEGYGKCSGRISGSHSIQRNGILSQLEDDTKAGKRLCSFEDWTYDNDSKISGFKLVGKAAASIFNGFCDSHDVELFAPIEQGALMLSPEQLFLFHYRGFAHSYHKVAEQYKFKRYVLNNMRPPVSPVDKMKYAEFVQEAHVFGILHQQHTRLKTRLNIGLSSDDYSGIQTYFREVPYFRIASSQILVAPYTFSGVNLRRWESLSYPVLTVIPDTNRTVVLFTYFIDDSKAHLFVEELKGLLENDFLQAVSSILIYSGANTYFPPMLLQNIGQEMTTRLCDEINYLSFYGHNHPEFFHSKVCLFV